MLGDKKWIWIFEYVLGLGLLAIAMPFIVRSQPEWSAAHGWAYLIFLSCSGFVLISCGSSMRQRMQLNKRVTQLEQQLESQRSHQKQSQSSSSAGQSKAEQFISSMN